MARLNFSFSHHSLLSRRLISATLLLSMLAGGCSAGTPQTQAAPPPPSVQLQQVTTSTVQESSEFVGALEAQQRVALRPEVEGRIVQILVESGQSVAAGTPIAEINADRNQAEVSGARADVSEAAAAVNTANAQLQAAIADRDRAAADVELRETEYRRTQTLVSEGAQAQQNLDEATNQLNTARAALRAAEEQVGAAQATLSESRARVARAQADEAAATSDLQDNLVRAPIAGVVGNVPTKVGDFVTTSTEITSIIQNSALDLSLSVPIERSAQLRVGLPVELLDAEGKPLVTGRIRFVSPEVNSAEQSTLAKASFPNNGRLKDGQLVRARLIWQTSPGILVPTNAVTRIAGQTFVYVAASPPEGGAQTPQAGQQAGQQTEQQAGAEPQRVAQQRLVRLGEIQGNSYQVLEGLKPGDEVIVTGILNLQDGSPISIAQASAGEQAPQ